jgi:hypothetical protein
MEECWYGAPIRAVLKIQPIQIGNCSGELPHAHLRHHLRPERGFIDLTFVASEEHE